MKRHFYFSKLIMFLSLTLIPISIFGLCTVFYINMQVKKSAIEHSASITALMEQTMDELTSTLEFYRVSVNSDTQIHLALIASLGNSETSSKEAIASNRTLQNLYYSQSTKPYIQSLFLTVADSPFFINGLNRETFSSATDCTWVEEARSHSNLTFFKVRHIKRNKFDTAETPVVTVYQRMKYKELMAINLRQDYFNQCLDSITNYKGQILLITDQEGQILFHNSNINPKNIDYTVWAEEIQKTRDYFYSSETLGNPYGLSFVSLIPWQEIFLLSNSIRTIALLAGAVSILVSSVLAYIYTARDYRQILQIIDLFSKAEKGEFYSQESHSHKNSAYFHIINNIIHLFMSQTWLKTQLDAKKYALSTAQLSALQYQLNPHFLFNTLQSIDLEILKQTKCPGTANQMIASLSRLLRYCLEAPLNPVSVQDEIKITKIYIQLQKQRLGDTFQVIWDFDYEILDRTMLRLLLQPIIENSISHRDPISLKPLIIKIKIRIQNGLSFTIIDNGPGISQIRLQELRQGLSDDQIEQNSRHIGLKNICQRIRLYYPKGCLSLWSKEGLGTIVRINGIEGVTNTPINSGLPEDPSLFF